MLRMDSGSKCTWYKFIKGAKTVSWVTRTDRRKDNSLLFTAELLKSTLAIII